MCVVSMVLESITPSQPLNPLSPNRFPNYLPTPNPLDGVSPSLEKYQWPPINKWTDTDVISFKKILDKLDEMDKKMGAADCFKKPEHIAILEELAERVARLEEENMKLRIANAA